MRHAMLLLLLLVSGCANTAATFEASPSNGVLSEQTNPPTPQAYSKIRTNNGDLYNYVDDFNWYLKYLFNYTTMLNRYALTRGWKPHESPPLCQLVDLPEMRVLPKFSPPEDATGSEFEWELVNYIKLIKTQYEESAKAALASKEAQRVMCIY